mmetsp:Transcript_7442/g.18724  ORF Transcript_7442/g.18724 Transcript_7442/m.18724 type:complete len:271 (+) Transcript_7442:276-1088(+)
MCLEPQDLCGLRPLAHQAQGINKLLVVHVAIHLKQHEQLLNVAGLHTQQTKCLLEVRGAQLVGEGRHGQSTRQTHLRLVCRPEVPQQPVPNLLPALLLRESLALPLSIRQALVTVGDTADDYRHRCECRHADEEKEKGCGPRLLLEDNAHGVSVRVDHHLQKPEDGARDVAEELCNLCVVAPDRILADKPHERYAEHENDEQQKEGDVRHGAEGREEATCDKRQLALLEELRDAHDAEQWQHVQPDVLRLQGRSEDGEICEIDEPHVRSP